MRGELVAVALAVALGACTQSHAGEPAVDAGGPSDELRAFLEAEWRERCRLDIACEPHAHVSAWCREPEYDAYSRRVASGRWNFDSVAAGRCLEGLRGLTGCYRDRTIDSPEECAWVFVRVTAPLGADCDPLSDQCGYDATCDVAACTCVPLLPEGAACGIGSTCAAGLFCLGDSTTMTGSCAPVSPAVGRPCVSPWDCTWSEYRPQRDLDLLCLEGRCAEVPLTAPGEPCIQLRCSEGLWCDWSTETCRVRSELGESCGGTFDGSPSCAEGLSCIAFACEMSRLEGEPCELRHDCDETAPYCVPGSRRTGSICSGSPDGLLCWVSSSPYARVQCPSGFECVPYGEVEPSGGREGLCRPLVGVGDPCSYDLICPDGSRCVAGRCARVVFRDQPCGPDAACPSSHACEDGRCRQRPAHGDPCDDAHPCTSDGHCVDGICGHLPPGAPCDSSLDCRYACEDGTCAAGGAEGEPCTWRFDCADGLVCATAGAESTCVPPCRGRAD